MSIPTLPPFFDMYYTKQDGKLTSDGYLYNDQMFQSLNASVFLINNIVSSQIINDGSSNSGTIINNGIKNVNYTTSEILALEPDADVGTIWFNTTLSKLQLKTAPGVIQTITSS